MMATLVVGPFYLSRALGLDAALVGLVLSAGPVVVVLSGVPAGGSPTGSAPGRVGAAGLAVMARGRPPPDHDAGPFGVVGYIAPIVVLTLGYASFQTANNTAVMAGARAEQRGVRLRDAQPVAQPRPHHRRLGDGRRVHVGGGDREPRRAHPARRS